MNVNRHLTISGRAYVIWGSFCLLLSVLLLLRDSFRLFTVGLERLGNPMVYLSFLLLVIVSAIAALQISLGLALLKRKAWSTHVPGYLISLVTLLSFPIGTFLGAYSLAILTQLDKQRDVETESDSPE